MRTGAVMVEERWYTYKQAAGRVRSSERTVRRWRRVGMPMSWELIDGQRTRVVREDVLLAWWRDAMDNSPVHQLRMRKRAKEAGVAYVAPVLKPRPKPKLVPTPRVEPDDDEAPSWPAPAPFHEPLDHMRPMAGRDEFATLLKATRDNPTGCRDVDEFTADQVTVEEQRVLAAICATCPVLELCRAYAVATKPTSGYWAGSPWRELSSASPAPSAADSTNAA
ncbi:WhiB family transcriptional regulator [Microbacterium sp. BLY]|uniref:WhiB family transcriptional regulator n=1 Tax=Microbacterium sp. BLY TaxID=2823280 RepID=UPI001B334548|nr:WhiB family transcriptional regulator [Microbacterium sp. BLY]MBP3977858.1 WhiB family transcriptional regulator [Microbacterium sp. BLY]